MKRIQSVTLLTLILAVQLAAQQATVREEKQVIKTYPFSGPEPVAGPAGRAGSAEANLSIFLVRRAHRHGGRPDLESGADGEPVHRGVRPAGRGRKADRRRREEHPQGIHLLQPRAQVPQHLHARAVDFGRNRSQFRHHRPRALHGHARGLPGPQEPRRQRELHRGHHGSALAHRVAGGIHGFRPTRPTSRPARSGTTRSLSTSPTTCG